MIMLATSLVQCLAHNKHSINLSCSWWATVCNVCLLSQVCLFLTCSPLQVTVACVFFSCVSICNAQGPPMVIYLRTCKLYRFISFWMVDEYKRWMLPFCNDSESSILGKNGQVSQVPLSLMNWKDSAQLDCEAHQEFRLASLLVPVHQMTM